MKLLAWLVAAVLAMVAWGSAWLYEPGALHLAPPGPGPRIPVALIGLDPGLARAAGASAVPPSANPLATWVAADRLAANRAELHRQLAAGSTVVVVGDGLDWEAVHRDLGLTPLVHRVAGSRPLQALAIRILDGLPRYGLVQGGPEPLGPQVLAMSRGTPWVSMQLADPGTGPPAFAPLGSAFFYDEVPPYGQVERTVSWCVAPDHSALTRYGIVDVLFWTAGRALNSTEGDPRYGRRNYLRSLAVEHSSVQPGVTASPPPLTEHCGGSQSNLQIGNLRWNDELGSFIGEWVRAGRQQFRYRIAGTQANTCIPRLALPEQGQANLGGEFVVSGSRAPLTYTQSWTTRWAPYLLGSVQRQESTTWRLTPLD